jgi:hypothetical protein
MTDIPALITQIAQRLEPLCRHVSVRNDERGLFVFAIAEDDIHSLELWHADGEFALELWRGDTAEAEQVVESPRCKDSAEAIERAVA